MATPCGEVVGASRSTTSRSASPTATGNAGSASTMALRSGWHNDMSIWPNVITGVCTLLAGLGGVWITQRGTTARTIEEWRDKHRIDQRKAVVEVLHLGRQWAYSLG